MTHFDKILQFVKNWTLPIAILVGFNAYIIFHYGGFSPDTHAVVNAVVAVLQPVLIFIMLFLTFCNVAFSDLRLQKWHIWLLLIQIIVSSVFACIALYIGGDWKVFAEAAFCCFVCPTATAAGIITYRLGGSIPKCSTYVILSNLMAAIVIPLFVPLLNPAEQSTFLSMFLSLTSKMFPLLIGPLFLAWIVRYTMPKFHKWLLQQNDWAFYIWIVLLPLAIAIATKAFFHSNVTLITFIGIAVATLLSCIAQFWFGWKVGDFYNERVTAGQALGQKNTAYIIWVAYTFLAPINAIAGGLYCVFHNNLNSLQLYLKKRADKKNHLK